MNTVNVLPLYEQLKMGIRQRVSGGEFSVGERLPGIREMAEHLGVNKNTVLRVYKELEAEGLLQIERGGGAYVRQLTHSEGTGDATLRDLMSRAIRLARVWGMGEAEVRRLTEECFMAVYRQEVRVAFVECHPYDAEVMAATVQAKIGVGLEPVVLDDLVADPGQYFAKYDLLATTFFHYGELIELAGAQWEHQVVGVEHTASVDSLRSLSLIPRGNNVGLVCKNERTLDRLSRLVGAYCLEPVRACLVSDEQTVRELLDTCDYVIDHPQLIRGFIGSGRTRCKVISLDFQVTEQSIEYLRKRVMQLALAGTAGPA